MKDSALDHCSWKTVIFSFFDPFLACKRIDHNAAAAVRAGEQYRPANTVFLSNTVTDNGSRDKFIRGIYVWCCR